MNPLPLDTFPAISLEQLNETAEMLTRIDRKYVLDRDTTTGFISALDPAMQVLEIDGRRQSSYETIYFDTPDLLSYHMSAQSRRIRVKVRTRSYVESRTSFLEVKTSGGDITVKDRIDYRWACRGALSDEGRVFAGEAFDTMGRGPDVADDLHVAITTRYRRATLLAPDKNGRITIDTDLSWMLPDGTSLALPDVVIVETKSRAAATDIDRLLWRGHCRPQPVSKFATGLAALRPELPRNRWARLLRGPFTPTTKELLCAAV